MFSELSVLLVSGGIFVTLQFYKLNCLFGENKFCLVFQLTSVKHQKPQKNVIQQIII